MPNEIAMEKDADGIGRAPRGLNDAKGFVFISHFGEVFPSGFLPMSAGNVRRQPLAEIYQHSPLFVSLRDTSRLQGKCGVCEFRNVCGGSRARAFALTGNPFAEEPRCIYEPRVTAATPCNTE
jgi:radical SAM protein with 4Fe4S-binding SPASM domain